MSRSYTASISGYSGGSSRALSYSGLSTHSYQDSSSPSKGGPYSDDASSDHARSISSHSGIGTMASSTGATSINTAASLYLQAGLLEAHWSRRFTFTLVTSNAFGSMILSVILLNTAVLAIQSTPYVSMNYGWYLSLLDQVFLGIYLMETLSKLFVFRWTYFKNSWNMFDFIIVLTSVVTFALTSLSIVRLFRIFRTLRAIRSLRALRAISFLKSLQIIVEALLSSLPAMSSIIALAGLTLSCLLPSLCPTWTRHGHAWTGCDDETHAPNVTGMQGAQSRKLCRVTTTLRPPPIRRRSSPFNWQAPTQGATGRSTKRHRTCRHTRPCLCIRQLPTCWTRLPPPHRASSDALEFMYAPTDLYYSPAKCIRDKHLLGKAFGLLAVLEHEYNHYHVQQGITDELIDLLSLPAVAAASEAKPAIAWRAKRRVVHVGGTHADSDEDQDNGQDDGDLVRRLSATHVAEGIQRRASSALSRRSHSGASGEHVGSKGVKSGGGSVLGAAASLGAFLSNSLRQVTRQLLGQASTWWVGPPGGQGREAPVSATAVMRIWGQVGIRQEREERGQYARIEYESVEP
ncbi:hypothetical protein BCR44DRAFT_1461840 [Catenaria anguillulae PL171]|uniref:Ion transport domain-containing protein n=1 Tax=Catenaria anguillulae PL171 TaxID=765915 RepID=A0A1Y2HKJ8_9FUNG|nr:hypothetical protein BCR44DRAFT_1461840 [Catenaria anguillulae PL171]